MKQEKWLVWSLCAVLVVGAGIWYMANTGAKSHVDSFTAESAATDYAENTGIASPAVSADSLHPDESDTASGEIAVYICGAISHPGVYRFAGRVRVCDVVDAAGGLKKQADSSAVNQARFVQDGEQIEIPTKQQSASHNRKQAVNTQGNATPDDSSGDKVNLNLATKEQLMTLPGIGEAKAEAVLAYREEHGSFQSPEDIMKISGIKDGVYQKIKEKITV